ncbi:uncharacterized protein J8A68_000091 [[Candida] subhashii]|uniref:RRM domain-containing protein n=1 Tax=[Candida] subhashii TaxID=561895 RepID=A0A8J5R7W4_9ASCO|nr:uncharacterized protein J8A68_000091 [[Candida] subhashii]KAG7666370.1 hypothetical protein J8A68_000091 [[Candida] subhashii]
MKIDNTEKYPINIQKLFSPKPPFRYLPPTDIPPEKRKTNSITPISNLKQQINQYIATDLPQIEQQQSANSQPQTSNHQRLQQAAELKRKQNQESYKRQLAQWNDAELFAKNEKEFMKDPYRTVFISRLDYQLTELDISSAFSKYGVIESIRIIRDHQGKSRGYGFIVYERDVDAKNVISELSRSGLQLNGRNVLVDMERGRIIRNWRPRRLGGGEGGRGYLKSGRVSSAAATARRVHIANNPNYSFQSQHHHQQQAPTIPQYASQHQPGYQSHSNGIKKPDTKVSIRDKYAKYSSSSSPPTSTSTSYTGTNTDRSIRSIRQS